MPGGRSAYAQRVGGFGERLLAIQQPIRLLEALRWPDSVRTQFLNSHGRELPRVSLSDYRNRPLRFDPVIKRQELTQLEQDILRELPADDPAAKLLVLRCHHYHDMIRLIETRGTPEFVKLNRRIFGTSIGKPKIRQAIDRLLDWFQTGPSSLLESDQESWSAESARDILADRSRSFFHDDRVTFKVVDSLSADATAGCDYLKIRKGATFTTADLRTLEVHEIWVHLATSSNGKAQPLFPILGKATAATMLTQEGLAVLTEYLVGANHPHRVQRLFHRITATRMAEEGADFIEVFRYFREQDSTPLDAYHLALRVFRGSLPTGLGPNTKDLTYGLGFDVMLRYMEKWVAANEHTTIGLLFSGKWCLEELPLLRQLQHEGWIPAPELIPEPYLNLVELRQNLARIRQETPVSDQ